MSDTSWVTAPKIHQLAIHPPEPKLSVNDCPKLSIGALHAIGISGERIDHELLVLRFPLSVPRVLVDNRLDIFLDVLQLSTLIV